MRWGGSARAGSGRRRDGASALGGGWRGRRGCMLLLTLALLLLSLLPLLLLLLGHAQPHAGARTAMPQLPGPPDWVSAQRPGLQLLPCVPNYAGCVRLALEVADDVKQDGGDGEMGGGHFNRVIPPCTRF